MTDEPVTVLAVDDQPTNLRLLDAVLTPRGHRVITTTSGAEALSLLETEDVDVVLLDILMPGMDGHEVCRRIRATPATEFLPVVMITASGSEQRLIALQSGADDFVTKPFDQSELLARVASLARIKRYHDTIRRQADELAAWNAELETRVATQLEELERTSRLRHFLSPQLADLVVGDEDLLRSHRREIVVVFTDLRNFTTFAEASEPEEVMGVLGEHHRAIGALVHSYNGTLERFTGDGVMVFFNDPVPCDDAAERAVRMSIDIRDEVRKLSAGWLRKGHDLGLGIGIAQGFATLGRIGFEGRSDYSAIGSVTNLAARLCGEAKAWQVLVTDRVLAPVEDTHGIGNRRRLAAQGIQPLGAGSQHHGDTRQVGGGMTRVQTAGRPLSGLSEEERYRYFDDLQLTMPTVWESMRLGFDDESVVVVPSISIEGPSGRSGTIMQAMEERALFLLLLLRQPRLRMIYVTSQPVSEAIVRVLPRAAPWGDSQPGAGAAHPGARSEMPRRNR